MLNPFRLVAIPPSCRSHPGFRAVPIRCGEASGFSCHLQVLGRYFEIEDAWETVRVGSRSAPLARVLGAKPVLFPGQAVVYKSAAPIAAAGGTMRGGYLVCDKPRCMLVDLVR